MALDRPKPGADRAVKHRHLSQELGECNGELDRLQAVAAESAGALGGLEEQTRAARETVAELEARRDAVSQHSHGMHLEIQGARHVIDSARKRGENLFQALRSTAGPSPLWAAGFA